MTNWTGEQWTLVALFLAATGSVLSGLHDWSEALKPSVMGGLIAQLAIAIRAFYTPKPTTPGVIQRWRKG